MQKLRILNFRKSFKSAKIIVDFYKNNELIALTKELTEMLRKNRTIDWQKKETARVSMRKMVKRLLKKYKYPPEEYNTAISTVISQCEMWVDHDMDSDTNDKESSYIYENISDIDELKVAESSVLYDA